MFKRVEKRRRKKQEEEELGLDEDMKEVLGVHDTDSDESDSDQASSVEDNGHEGHELAEAGFEGDSGANNEDSDSEDAEGAAITVQEALRDPVYLVSLQPDVKACIVCPGKLLKDAKMVELHRNSNAHERRIKQFKTLAADAGLKENAWDVLRRNSEERPKLSLVPSEKSKRSEKRREKLNKLKAKREKQKAKTKAKRAAMSSADSNAMSPKDIKPSKKKQKLERPKIEVPVPDLLRTEGGKAPAPAKGGEKSIEPSIQSIVRSTSDRAKQARSRALTSSKRSKKPLQAKSEQRRRYRADT